MKIKKLLIVAPHPDDEVLGCGGTIKKFIEQMHEVIVLIMTRGSKKKYSDEKILNVRNEAKNAHKLLGVKNTIFLDYPAPELDLISLAEISNSINKIVSELEIDTIFLPHRGDIHNDHRVIFNASLVAVRPVGNYKVKNIFAYETLSETEWAPPFGDDAFIPTHFVDISDTINSKTEAFDCYKSQVRAYPNPRSIKTIKSLAAFRGSTIGVNYAEAFMTIRTID